MKLGFIFKDVTYEKEIYLAKQDNGLVFTEHKSEAIIFESKMNMSTIFSQEVIDDFISQNRLFQFEEILFF